VLTDPLLRDRVIFLQRHGDNPAPQMLAERSPDVVLISHLHYDHADLGSLRMLPKGTPVVAPRGSGLYLARGTGLEIHEVRAGDRLRVADVEITAVPASHGKKLSLPLPATACLGFAVRNRLSVYFAGDTGLFEEMHDVGREFDLDLALLPVWGYGHSVGAGHLTPRTAAEALLRLKPRVAVPIHWGAMRLPGPHALWKSVGYLKRPPRTFAEHASLLSPGTDVRILQPGESTTLN
jgi:L-ascorbate metabolism protein UlaG (beta-lactamase superfamily)